MSKKTNSLFFVLGATVFNIIVTFVCFILLYLLFVLVVSILPDSLKSTAASWSYPVSFLGAIILSFVIYRIVLKILVKKVDMEKHFDPVIGYKRKPPQDTQ